MEMGSAVMAKITIKDNYTAKLSLLTAAVADKAISHAVYMGAGMVADEINTAIDAIPPISGSAAEGTMRGVTTLQREGLKDGLGISKMENANGYVNVKIGFNGYNKQTSKKYPKGEPNAMIARSIESGSSISTKTPFVSPVSRRMKKTVIAKMQNVLDDEFEKAMK